MSGRSRLTAWGIAAILVSVLAVPGCGSPTDSPGGEPNAPEPSRTETAAAQGSLAGTSWRLVQFQSMDDAIGTIRPADPTRFTMRLDDGGSVSMQLDCNRANGTWSTEPSDDGSSGSFAFGPLAMTRAKCPPPNLDERIAKDAGYIRSYLLQDGRLHLGLMADGGIYTWEPIGGTGAPSE